MNTVKLFLSMFWEHHVAMSVQNPKTDIFRTKTTYCFCFVCLFVALYIYSDF